MTGMEVERYWMDIHQWRNDVLPRLASVKKWGNDEWKEFDRGLCMLSALRSARDFALGAHRMLPAKAVRTMQSFLSDLDDYIRRNASELHVTVTDHDGITDIQSHDTALTLNTPERRTIRRFVTRVAQKAPATVPAASPAGSPATVPEASPSGFPEVSGRRPSHLSQYIHLLPENLQKESQNIENWYLTLADAHNHLHELVDNDDGRASDADRRACAEKVALTEQKILNFWARVDMAYEESQGRRVSAVLKKSLAHEARNLATSGKVKGDMEYTREEIEAMEDGEEKERIRAARIQRDKHFITRCNAKDKPGSRAKVRIAIQELHDWGFLLSAKLQENAISYGFDDIPKDWYSVTPAEKEEMRRQKEEEERLRLEHEKEEAERHLREEEERRQREQEEAAAARKADRDRRRKEVNDLFSGTFINS